LISFIPLLFFTCTTYFSKSWINGNEPLHYTHIIQVRININQVIRYRLWALLIFKVYAIMEFNTTFNNISVILWRSVLLVEETGVPGENH
jgi:hypothetical protein